MRNRELYLKYRPRRLDDIFGQDEAVEVLRRLLKKKMIPHASLFSGPSGCGKTTLARILTRELDCKGTDVSEINAANFRGIDTIRDIQSRVGQSPIAGTCRVWIIDEAHQLGGPAQNAFLKLLEDTPDHVYFMLATTEPTKLIATIRNRCTDIKVKALTNTAMADLLNHISKKAKDKLSEEVRDKIIEVADGSARKALVLYNAVLPLDDDEARIEAIMSPTAEMQAIEIARALMKTDTTWKEMAKIIKAVDEEPETIRRLVLGYANTVALSGNQRGFMIIDCFSNNYFDVGKAGLTWSCWQIVNAGNKRR